MAKIDQIVNDVTTGAEASSRINEAIKSVEVDSDSFEGDGNIGTQLTAKYRRKSQQSCNGSGGQVITYSTPLVGAGRPFLDDYQGLGIALDSWNDNGFTITSLVSGNFGYETKIDK